MPDGKSLAAVDRVGDVDRPHRIGKADTMTVGGLEVGVGNGNDARIRLAVREGQDQALWGSAENADSGLSSLAVPDEG